MVGVCASSDDSLGYEFPFTLKIVQANGIHCGLCPWTKFCKGCPLPPTPEPLPSGSETNSPAIEGVLNYCIAVDWEPTALHLRYQTSLEKVAVFSPLKRVTIFLIAVMIFLQVFDEDTSVAQAVHQQTEPVSLEQCLQAFTREEQLSGDEKYYCPKCATHQPATKKLQIWRLPPILVEILSGSWRFTRATLIIFLLDCSSETFPVCQPSLDQVSQGGSIPSQ